jgi:hypothetical protein
VLCPNWNVEWAKSGSKAGELIEQRLRDIDADVIYFRRSATL